MRHAKRGARVKILHWVEDGAVHVFPGDTEDSAILKFAWGYKRKYSTWENSESYGTWYIYSLHPTFPFPHNKKKVAYISSRKVQAATVCEWCGSPPGLIHKSECKHAKPDPFG